MLYMKHFTCRSRAALVSLICGASFALAPLAALATGTVTLAWDPSPTTNDVIANYNLYYGVASGTYTNVVAAGTNLTASVSNLVEGITYYFAATAVDTNGLESDYSAEVSAMICRPPTLNSLANMSINESAGLQTVNLSGITSGSSNQVQTLVVTASSSNPSLIPAPAVSYTSPNTTGSITFTPVPYGNGSAVITVTVNNGEPTNNTSSSSFTVTVNPVNQPPTLNSLANMSINESAGLQTVNLSGITSGATNEIQTLTVTASSSNTGLIPTPTVNYASPNTTGTITFTPVPTANGSATITVTVNDGGASNNIVSRTFTVTVNPVNQPPTLNSLANLNINENAGQQTVNLAGITSGASNQVQTLVVTASSSNTGLIPTPTVNYTSPNTTGSITFTPVTYSYGSATITVTVNNGGASNNIVTQSFTVTVNPVNQPPTLNSLANVNINENAGLQTVNLSGITSGASNQVQTLAVTASSSNPSLIPTPTVNYTSPNTTGSITFIPVTYGYGSATITVTVNNGGASNNIVSRTFTVTVNPVNQPPTLNSLANVNINENAGQQTVNLSGITSGASNQVQTLVVTASSSNTGLIPTPTVSYTSPNTTGSITFTPVTYGYGSATITVTVNNGGASNNVVTQSFTVTVNPVNQPPTLNSLANMNINENAGLQTVNLSGITSGASNQVQTLVVTASSSNTGLIPTPTVNYTSPNTTGSITFTPVTYSYGSATITVTVNNGGASNNIVTQSFTVTVNPVNQPPTLNSLANLSINENAGLQTVNLSGITSGASNEVQTLTVTASSSNTGLIPTPTVNYTSPNTTGSITFTPVPNAFGSAIITVTVNDGGTSNNVVSCTFSVIINPVNQAPTLDPLANVTINENAGLQTVSLTGISSGATNQVQPLVINASSSNPGLIPNPTVNYTSPNTSGSITFAPVTFGFGSAIVTVTVNNGGVSNNIISRAFTVTVNPVNQPPTLNSLANLNINENAGLQTVNLSGITSGASNEVQTLTVTASSSNPSLIPTPTVNYTSPNTTGSITFTPVAYANGSAVITVTVNDGGASNNIVTQSFTVTVNPVNQPPTLNSLANLNINENAGQQTVNLSGITSGASNEVQTLTVTASSSNTGLIPTPTVTYTSPNTTGTLTFTPVASAYGTANISVTVNDGGLSNNIVTRSFTVTVNQVDSPPTISSITNLVIAMNTSTPAIPFTINDLETPASSLTLSGSSDNTNLVAVAGIVFGGSDSDRTVTVTPATNQIGVANITITVSDGITNASSVFQLSVRMRPAAPGELRLVSTGP